MIKSIKLALFATILLPTALELNGAQIAPPAQSAPAAPKTAPAPATLQSLAKKQESVDKAKKEAQEKYAALLAARKARNDEMEKMDTLIKQGKIDQIDRSQLAAANEAHKKAVAEHATAQKKVEKKRAARHEVAARIVNVNKEASKKK